MRLACTTRNWKIKTRYSRKDEKNEHLLVYSKSDDDPASRSIREAGSRMNRIPSTIWNWKKSKRHCRKYEKNCVSIQCLRSSSMIHYLTDISSFTLVNQAALEQLCAKLGDNSSFCNNNSFDDPSSTLRSRLALVSPLEALHLVGLPTCRRSLE